MALVASEQKNAAAAGKPGDEEWKVTDLYFEHLESYYQEAMVDVVKVTTRMGKLKNVPIPSISNTACKAKDALEKDPSNMKLINNLGYLYWKEGQHEQCLNVMMRGWKRAGEIPDARVRFRFLMKLGELSMGFWKYRQGLAIWRDIQEPADKKELKSYVILGTQLWCNNGDLQQSLKLFHRAIAEEPYQAAVRIFAVMVLDLKKVGGYEAAKSAMEPLQPNDRDAELWTLDHFVQQVEERKKTLSPDQAQKRFIIACITIGVLFFLAILWYFERQSLATIRASKS